MIIQQLVSAGAANMLVVDDDPDIFVLLSYFVFLGDIYGHVMIISQVRGQAFIDINYSV